MAMGKDQRDAIRKALNEDAEKLLQQGDPNDPQLRRLEREIDEVNKLFDEFERRAAEDARRLSARAINDQLTVLMSSLEDAERTLAAKIIAPLPRDLDQLEQLVVEHKAFETELQALEPELVSAKENVESCPRKTPSMQSKYVVSRCFILFQFLLHLKSCGTRLTVISLFQVGSLFPEVEHAVGQLEFVHRAAEGG